MAKRKLLKDQDRRKLVDIPVDEDSLIRHYSLSLADRLEIELRRRNHNWVGFAIQLCLMRYPGRVLGAEETPPRAMLKYVADQIAAAPDEFALYARREETRRDHMARLMVYLDIRSATLQDRSMIVGQIEIKVYGNFRHRLSFRPMVWHECAISPPLPDDRILEPIVSEVRVIENDYLEVRLDLLASMGHQLE